MGKSTWRLEIRRSSDGSLKYTDTIVDTEFMALVEAKGLLLADAWEDDENNEIAVINTETKECHYHFCLFREDPKEIKTYRFEHKASRQVAFGYGETVEEAFEQIVDFLPDKDQQSWEAIQIWKEQPNESH